MLLTGLPCAGGRAGGEQWQHCSRADPGAAEAAPPPPTPWSVIPGASEHRDPHVRPKTLAQRVWGLPTSPEG